MAIDQEGRTGWSAGRREDRGKRWRAGRERSRVRREEGRESCSFEGEKTANNREITTICT